LQLYSLIYNSPNLKKKTMEKSKMANVVMLTAICTSAAIANNYSKTAQPTGKMYAGLSYFTSGTNGVILSAWGAIHSSVSGAVYGAVFGGPVGFAVGLGIGL
jgi:hypothetical protein